MLNKVPIVSSPVKSSTLSDVHNMALTCHQMGLLEYLMPSLSQDPYLAGDMGDILPRLVRLLVSLGMNTKSIHRKIG